VLRLHQSGEKERKQNKNLLGPAKA